MASRRRQDAMHADYEQEPEITVWVRRDKRDWRKALFRAKGISESARTKGSGQSPPYRTGKSLSPSRSRGDASPSSGRLGERIDLFQPLCGGRFCQQASDILIQAAAFQLRQLRESPMQMTRDTHQEPATVMFVCVYGRREGNLFSFR